MGLNAKEPVLLSKTAAGDGHGEDSPYFDGWKAYDRNPFHPTRNPEGVIQMGLAENELCFDLIVERIKENPNASICTAEGVENFKHIANFQDYHGLKEFRQGIAKLMEKARGGRVKFDPERIVMSGGATGANETIMFCLANQGDAFLVPTPYYPAFNRDLRWRTDVQIVTVECRSSNNFALTREAVEAAYEKAQEANINVKGLILTNPSNPLGTTLDRETLKSLVNFVNDKSIHLVCDEIYAATVFSSPDFVSVAEIVQEMDASGSVNHDLIHIIYSLSKDMGLPGFRVGIVYSYNDKVVNCSRRMSSFGLVSSQTQYFLANLLSDDEFVDNFLRESSKRLARRHYKFTKGLEQVRIKCLKSNAGLFVWMDLRNLLEDPTSFDAEMNLWRVIVNDVKLNVSPGSSFHVTEPGWFRVCFANMDDETVDVALQRIQDFVCRAKEKEAAATAEKATAPPKNKKRGQMNLRLSFSSRSRKYDEQYIMSPHMMSPHSPIPQSPLLKART